MVDVERLTQKVMEDMGWPANDEGARRTIRCSIKATLALSQPVDKDARDVANIVAAYHE